MDVQLIHSLHSHKTNMTIQATGYMSPEVTKELMNNISIPIKPNMNQKDIWVSLKIWCPPCWVQSRLEITPTYLLVCWCRIISWCTGLPRLESGTTQGEICFSKVNILSLCPSLEKLVGWDRDSPWKWNVSHQPIIIILSYSHFYSHMTNPIICHKKYDHRKNSYSHFYSHMLMP